MPDVPESPETYLVASARAMTAEALRRLGRSLPVEALVEPRLRKLYAAMVAAAGAELELDDRVIWEHLEPEDRTEPTMALMHHIQRIVPGPANWAHYGREVMEGWQYRRLVELVEEGALSPTRVREIVEQTTWRHIGTRSVGDVVAEAAGMNGDGMITTGLIEVDKLVGGWSPGDVVVIGARTSVGKTALALQLARTQARAGIPAGYLSYEMPAAMLGARLLAAETGIGLGVIRMGGGDPGRIAEARARIGQWPLEIADDAPRKVEEALDVVRQTRERGTRVVYVDYLTLMSADDARAPRYLQVGEMMHAIKDAALREGLVMVVLAQLARASEARREPSLVNLRESGDIEQDADAVLLLHRARDERGNLSRDGQVTVAKARNGMTGRVVLAFDAPTQVFTERPQVAR